MLKDIIAKCKEVGFKLSATLLDQGTDNQAAINYLMKKTNSQNQNMYLIFLYKYVIKNGTHI